MDLEGAQGMAARADDRVRPAGGGRGAASGSLREQDDRPVTTRFAAALAGHHGGQLAASAAAAARAAAKATGRSGRAEEFDAIADAGGARGAPRCQEEAGVDLVTDGEQRRDNFYSFVAEKLDGRAADDAGRDAGHRRGQGRLRADAPDARRPRLLHQQPDLRRDASRGGGRWRVDELRFVRRHTDGR